MTTPGTVPAIAGARLPDTYVRAKDALAACSRIDECKDWADKAEALASYAKQAKDDVMQHTAVRIQARAIRRCGELLKKFQNQQAGLRRGDAPPTGGMTQRKAAGNAVSTERGGCVLWIRAAVKGYGIKWIRRRMVLVHRLSWSLEHGPIPAGMFVLHRCDIPACFNVEHLFLGTQADNLADMTRKGRRRNQNNGKTHCIWGHPFDEANTRRDSDGNRHCRQCDRRAERKKHALVCC